MRMASDKLTPEQHAQLGCDYIDLMDKVSGGNLNSVDRVEMTMDLFSFLTAVMVHDFPEDLQDDLVQMMLYRTDDSIWKMVETLENRGTPKTKMTEEKRKAIGQIRSATQETLQMYKTRKELKGAIR